MATMSRPRWAATYEIDAGADQFIKDMSRAYIELASVLDDNCPPGPSLETAQQRLRESLMWATAAITNGRGTPVDDGGD